MRVNDKFGPPSQAWRAHSERAVERRTAITTCKGRQWRGASEGAHTFPRNGIQETPWPRTTPYEVVAAEAEEADAVEQRWAHGAGTKLRKPPKDYKYVDELAYLQFELIKLQEWVRLHGVKLLVLFEGRDAAGKGGAIKR